MDQGVVAQKLYVAKQQHTILDGLSFEVKPGVLTGLIGPSGSGKTTLMRAMAGLQIPSRGSLTLGGIKAGDKKLRKVVGYVTQDPAIYEDLTAEQNLRYFARLLDTDNKNVKNVITAVDLTKQSSQLASTLSGGQRARVSLAIALLGNPEVLLLDEPTVGLDPVLRQDLWRLFRSLAEKGKTIVISSHVMDEAERCDKVLLLRNGSLLWSNTTKGLLRETSSQNVEEAFLKLVRHA